MRLAGAVLVVVMWQGVRVAPEVKHFAFGRAVSDGTAGAGGRVCVALDGAVYAHSKADLADLRLMKDGAEVPYVVTRSETAARGEAADVLNVGRKKDGAISFDLRMPARAYSEVKLDLVRKNFVATAVVTGMGAPGGKGGTGLGKFTVFDLSGQRLGRSTTLRLGEVTFAYLHVEMRVAGVAEERASVTVVGAEVPPSREAQTIYTGVAEAANFVQEGRETVATLELPARVPVERVSFVMEAGDRTNFSRGVEVRVRRAVGKGEERAEEEVIGGEISRVRMREDGQEIEAEQLSVLGTVGSNAQGGATVKVRIENGDDRPLQVRAVRLEMRERRACFDAQAGVRMMYGDAGLAAPEYDYARTFDAGGAAAVGGLGAEVANAGYVARAGREKSFFEGHPEVMWLALLGVVGSLGMVAWRSGKGV